LNLYVSPEKPVAVAGKLSATTAAGRPAWSWRQPILEPSTFTEDSFNASGWIHIFRKKARANI
jgi:hypothetical protein